MITTLIALVSGGSLTAIIKLLFDHRKGLREAHEKEIDNRIAAWQKISDRNEARLEQLEQKLSSCDRDFRSLERYVLSLEQTIVRAGLPLDLPRPVLERESDK
jgi:TolA-binding protein